MITHLDELPTHCAIAESCGLVSILSGIVSSHSSVGLTSIASSLLALIQNAIGSREIQNARKLTDIAALDQRLAEIKRIQKSMLEAFHLMNERQLRFEATLSDMHPLLNHVAERTWMLVNTNRRFKKQSKIGADAIEIFDEDFVQRSGNIFKLRPGTHMKPICFIPTTLFSQPIDSDIAKLSLLCDGPGTVWIGVVSPHLVDTGTKSIFHYETNDIPSWTVQERSSRSNVMIEVDTRAHARSVKIRIRNWTCREDINKAPIPFRFVVQFDDTSPPVVIKSLTFSNKPTLTGDKLKLRFPE
ncbi:hypothetical protein BLNAU_3396 [Blattamonas nauphoetae]|uniref:Uncharacterized protein n=1 Tax=Blattamonas nauphoetae TaxID=2049346 RepID=A0ABQ9YD34_9EUKA|nr:hypothetical protein BLNAU_3396 [Blattamonas nauphoetae]